MNRLLKISTIFIFSVIIAAFGAGSVQAADPQFLVSWKADTSVPQSYTGKSMPVNGSTITVSFEMIGDSGNQSGKILDLTNNNVRWYINGDLLSQGKNEKTFSFITADDNDTETDVKISAEYADPVAGYSYFVDKYVTIHLSHPQVIVNQSGMGGPVSIGSGTKFFALPYFFNTLMKNLSIQWAANGQTIPTDPKDPWHLNVNIGSNYVSGAQVDISAIVQNIFDMTMQAQKDYIFTVK
jgi:hypothetical protein